MSRAEITYRVWNALFIESQRWGLFTAKVVPPADLSRQSGSWLFGVKGLDANRYCQAANTILEGRYEMFALKRVNVGSIPEWNRDPYSGTTAPLVFGKRLNYQNPKLVGDIKYLWEINRHSQLVVLAQAYHLSNNERYLNGLITLMTSWFDQCPYHKGPNWASSLEVSVRLISWSCIWHLIAGINCPLFTEASGRVFLNRWLRSIYQHAHFIHKNFSRFSSANNHLIGEATGLFVAATVWPFWQDSIGWQEVAKGELIREASLQNAPDGVNREQAVWYQQFVLDFLLVAALVGLANGCEFPKDYWNRIEKMMEYLASVMDVDGHVPMIGDADDGLVIKFSQEDQFCPYRSLLATGAILFKRGDFKAKAGRLDDKTRWLLGEKADPEFRSIQTTAIKLPVHQAFPEGGYYILGHEFENEKEIRLVVDAGPLGYKAIAAHGHSDALAFTLSVSGQEFLIDPGTFSYHAEKKWRDYFKGTSAHNTIRIDGENQSVIGGNFMWMQKANAVLEVWEPDSGVDRFMGMHDGYTRLPDPVIHRREISLSKHERRIVVTDTLECQGRHGAELFWHFSEKCNVSIDGTSVFARSDKANIRMHISDDVCLRHRCPFR